MTNQTKPIRVWEIEWGQSVKGPGLDFDESVKVVALDDVQKLYRKANGVLAQFGGFHGQSLHDLQLAIAQFAHLFEGSGG